MEIWQLNTFRAVAKTLHFTRASEELGLTQSAVSHQVKSLENELGVKLFTRNKRKITLTPHGQKVLAHADKMLRQVDQMKREIRENRETLKGELKLIAIPLSLDTPFPQLRKAFQKKYDEIDITFQGAPDTETMLEMVRKSDVDVGFSGKGLLNLFNYAGILSIPWGVFEMLPVVGKDHPLAGKKKVSLDDLKNEEWIMFEKGIWARFAVDDILSQNGIEPDNIFEVNDGAVIRSIIKNSQGIALLPSWGIVEELKSGELVLVKPDNFKADVPLNIITSSNQRSRLISALIDFLLANKIEGLRLYEEKKAN